MRLKLLAPLAAALIVTGVSAAAAQERGAGGGAKAGGKRKAPPIALPPLPADRTVRQSAVVGGRTLDYDATVGTLPVRDAQGKTIAEIVFPAYVLRGGAPHPPGTLPLHRRPGRPPGLSDPRAHRAP